MSAAQHRALYHTVEHTADQARSSAWSAILFDALLDLRKVSATVDSGIQIARSRAQNSLECTARR